MFIKYNFETFNNVSGSGDFIDFKKYQEFQSLNIFKFPDGLPAIKLIRQNSTYVKLIFNTELERNDAFENILKQAEILYCKGSLSDEETDSLLLIELKEKYKI